MKADEHKLTMGASATLVLSMGATARSSRREDLILEALLCDVRFGVVKLSVGSSKYVLSVPNPD